MLQFKRALLGIIHMSDHFSQTTGRISYWILSFGIWLVRMTHSFIDSLSKKVHRSKILIKSLDKWFHTFKFWDIFTNMAISLYFWQCSAISENFTKYFLITKIVHNFFIAPNFIQCIEISLLDCLNIADSQCLVRFSAQTKVLNGLVFRKQTVDVLLIRIYPHSTIGKVGA